MSETGLPPSPPPAGWYPAPEAPDQLRWWDGSAWGPLAPPATNAWALAAHLGVFLFAVVVPAIARHKIDIRDNFARAHATEALNFQITGLLFELVVIIPLFFTAAAGSMDAANEAGTFPVLLIPMFALMMALIIGVFVLSVLGAVRAGQQRPFRYPVSIRFFQGGFPKASPAPGR